MSKAGAASSGDRGPLRICLLSYRNNPHSGGQGVYVRNLGRALLELGHRVDLVCGPPHAAVDDGIRRIQLPCLDLYNPADLFRTPGARELADPVNVLEWLGVSTMGFPEPLTFGLRAYRLLRRRLADYDVLHDNQSLSYGLWALSRSAPMVATIHHPVTVDRRYAVRAARPLWRKFQQWRWHSFIGMQQRVARSLRPVITVSECARADVCREFRIPAANTRVVSNGIDTQLFRPLAGISREPGRVMVTTSADMPLKGLVHLMHAVARVRCRRPVRLVVIGTPNADGAVIRQIRALGLGDHVEFTGRISAVPVISTTGGALPEVVGDAGLLVPPADPASLAAAIQRVLGDPGYAGELGRCGLQRVHRLFTWRRAAEATVAAYREAIDDHRRLRAR